MLGRWTVSFKCFGRNSKELSSTCRKKRDWCSVVFLLHIKMWFINVGHPVHTIHVCIVCIFASQAFQMTYGVAIAASFSAQTISRSMTHTRTRVVWRPSDMWLGNTVIGMRSTSAVRLWPLPGGNTGPDVMTFKAAALERSTTRARWRHQQLAGGGHFHGGARDRTAASEPRAAPQWASAERGRRVAGRCFTHLTHGSVRGLDKDWKATFSQSRRTVISVVSVSSAWAKPTRYWGPFSLKDFYQFKNNWKLQVRT